ncbi:STAS domain-containing protein [Lentzea cavernae]|uniref:Anti-anti-sigma factor n=1 Tax=Lentzea cavernae TaxID=2020703 RepID=A0ABQ3MCY7_9PSEU|nr:STAS domain-containing protein [Lentzea cavernae]GHH40160.1 anti-anti-sigma factor [Lentzea cavernae]
MTPLTLTTTTDPQGRPVLKVAGEIDLSNTATFETALAQNKGPLVVDLTEVHYIDSAGMSVLFTHAERVEVVATSLLVPLLEMSGLTSMATVRGVES